MNKTKGVTYVGQWLMTSLGLWIVFLSFRGTSFDLVAVLAVIALILLQLVYLMGGVACFVRHNHSGSVPHHK